MNPVRRANAPRRTTTSTLPAAVAKPAPKKTGAQRAWNGSSGFEGVKDGAQAVTLHSITGATTSQEAKVRQAAALLEKVLNSAEFRDEVLEMGGAINTAGLSNEQIYAKLMEGAEGFSPGSDHEADLNVALYSKKWWPWSREVAWSGAKEPAIHLNRKFFASADPSDVAGTLAHEWSHQLGFNDSGADSRSIPYKVGEIVSRLAERFATGTPTPIDPTTPTTPTTPANPGTPAPGADYFTPFHQGGAGNCVSIAAIKAGMRAFGTDSVFASLEKSGGGWDFTMRDGFKGHLTADELGIAKSYSKIAGDDPRMVEKANVLFGAMAKRAQVEGNDGWRPNSMWFATACNSLDNGEAYLEGPHWLGLDGFVKEIDPAEIGKYDAAVGASRKHAVYESAGYIDHFGEKVAGRVNGHFTDGFGRSLIGAYALVP